MEQTRKLPYDLADRRYLLRDPRLRNRRIISASSPDSTQPSLYYQSSTKGYFTTKLTSDDHVEPPTKRMRSERIPSGAHTPSLLTQEQEIWCLDIITERMERDKSIYEANGIRDVQKRDTEMNFRKPTMENIEGKSGPVLGVTAESKMTNSCNGFVDTAAFLGLYQDQSEICPENKKASDDIGSVSSNTNKFTGSSGSEASVYNSVLDIDGLFKKLVSSGLIPSDGQKQSSVTEQIEESANENPKVIIPSSGQKEFLWMKQQGPIIPGFDLIESICDKSDVEAEYCEPQNIEVEKQIMEYNQAEESDDDVILNEAPPVLIVVEDDDEEIERSSEPILKNAIRPGKESIHDGSVGMSALAIPDDWQRVKIKAEPIKYLDSSFDEFSFPIGDDYFSSVSEESLEQQSVGISQEYQDALVACHSGISSSIDGNTETVFHVTSLPINNKLQINLRNPFPSNYNRQKPFVLGESTLVNISNNSGMK